MKSQFTTQCLVLRVTPFGDTGSIATLLSSSHGRISAVARSAKNSKRRFSGGIDIFDCGIAELCTAKSNSALFTCSSFQRNELWLTLRKSLLKLSLASLATELILQLSTDNDGHSCELYNPIIEFLRALDATKNSNAAFASLVKVLLESLTIAGYAPLACQELFPEELLAWWNDILSSPTLPTPKHREVIHQSTTKLVQFAEKIIERQLNSRDGVISAAKTTFLAAV